MSMIPPQFIAQWDQAHAEALADLNRLVDATAAMLQKMGPDDTAVFVIATLAERLVKTADDPMGLAVAGTMTAMAILELAKRQPADAG